MSCGSPSDSNSTMRRSLRRFATLAVAWRKAAPKRVDKPPLSVVSAATLSGSSKLLRRCMRTAWRPFEQKLCTAISSRPAPPPLKASSASAAADELNAKPLRWPSEWPDSLDADASINTDQEVRGLPTLRAR